jgi:hypothetical protein
MAFTRCSSGWGIDVDMFISVKGISLSSSGSSWLRLFLWFLLVISIGSLRIFFFLLQTSDLICELSDLIVLSRKYTDRIGERVDELTHP